MLVFFFSGGGTVILHCIEGIIICPDTKHTHIYIYLQLSGPSVQGIKPNLSGIIYTF